jgi:SpoIID/LytB domain protein
MSWSGSAQFEAPTMELVMPGTDHVYRSALRSSNRDTVNVLSLDNYTRGVVAREMPSSWHAEALKAQSVAARTYGARALTSKRHYDICDTTSCQVYGGVGAETSSTDNAVEATSGKILTHDGKPAFAQFSSSSGGYTAPGSQPYLKAVKDSWDDWSGNKNHDWTKSVSASTIQKKYSSIGTLRSMKVTKRNGFGDWGGRVTSLELRGSKGTKTISGDDARWAFGLRSNRFTF